jgi:hypothetical protein
MGASTFVVFAGFPGCDCGHLVIVDTGPVFYEGDDESSRTVERMRG